MPELRHLTKAPITEALFDIRVKARPGFEASNFDKLKSKLSDRFPDIKDMRGGKFTLQFQPKGDPISSMNDLGLQGYFFGSDAEKLIAQFRIDGFTLNKLKPYTDWDELLPIFIELWQDYLSIADPEAVTRQALRYINHIPIISDFVDFDEYLRAAPQIPPELPQLLAAFFSRVTIIDNERSLAANVVQAFEHKPGQSGITIILDIDAYKQVDLSHDDETLIDNFSQLREFKNMIFFNYLNEKTLGLFE